MIGKRTLLVIASLSLLTGSASTAAADDNNSAAEHSAAMHKGMTHDEATAETKRKRASKGKKMKGDGPAAAHSKAMGKGTHDEASAATRESGTDSPAAAHSKAMSEGMTHDQATESTKTNK